MSTLLARGHDLALFNGKLWETRRRERFLGEGDGFPANELKPMATQGAARPIPPQERSRRRQGWRQQLRGQSGSGKRISRQRPKHGADPSWLFGGRMLLTLLPKRATAAKVNTTSIQHAQRAIVFGSALLRIEGLVSRAAQGAVGLQRKSGARKPAGKRAFGPLRRTIDHRSGWFTGRGGEAAWAGANTVVRTTAGVRC